MLGDAAALCGFAPGIALAKFSDGAFVAKWGRWIEHGRETAAQMLNGRENLFLYI